MPTDVVVVGSVNADLVVHVPRHPLPGETLLGDGPVVLAGGKGANQAVAAARLGARVALVGAVGTDANAEVALAELRGAGVDLTALRVVDGPTGLAVVTLAEGGENTIVVLPGANAAVTPDAVDAAARTVGAARVCVLQAEIPVPAVVRAVAVARAAGVRVLLNVAPATVLPRAALAAADPLVVNEHEAAVLLGEPEAGDPDAAVDGLLALGARSVVLTLGAVGAVGHDGDGRWRLPARPVRPVDTTGAGDAFVGALAAGLAAGDPLRHAAAHATRVAAASVLHRGAQPSYPWKDDPLP